MNTISHPQLFERNIYAVREIMQSIRQDISTAKDHAFDLVRGGKRQRRAKLTAMLSGNWTDIPEVQGLIDQLHEARRFELEIESWKKLLAKVPQLPTVNSSTINQLWSHYRREHDAADPFSLGHDVKSASASHRANPAPPKPAQITVTLAPGASVETNTQATTQRAIELCQSLCKAIARTSLATTNAKCLMLDMTTFAAELKGLLETARADVLRDLTADMQLSGMTHAEIGNEISAKCAMALRQIDSAMRYCDVAAWWLQGDKATMDECMSWVRAGRGMLPNLMDATLGALVSLYVSSYQTRHLVNFGVMEQAEQLAGMFKRVDGALRGAALRFALTHPERSDFLSWLKLHQTQPKSE